MVVISPGTCVDVTCDDLFLRVVRREDDGIYGSTQYRAPIVRVFALFRRAKAIVRGRGARPYDVWF